MSSSVLKSISRLLCLKVYVVVFKSVIWLRTLVYEIWLRTSVSPCPNIENVVFLLCFIRRSILNWLAREYLPRKETVPQPLQVKKVFKKRIFYIQKRLKNTTKIMKQFVESYWDLIRISLVLLKFWLKFWWLTDLVT